MDFVDDIECKVDPRDSKAFLAALGQKVTAIGARKPQK
jgi:hypothetical protein